MNSWVLDKATSLSEILAERGDLAEDERQLLEPLVRKHLERHGGDAGRSLSALTSVGSVGRDPTSIAAQT